MHGEWYNVFLRGFVINVIKNFSHRCYIYVYHLSTLLTPRKGYSLFESRQPFLFGLSFIALRWAANWVSRLALMSIKTWARHDLGASYTPALCCLRLCLFPPSKVQSRTQLQLQLTVELIDWLNWRHKHEYELWLQMESNTDTNENCNIINDIMLKSPF